MTKEELSEIRERTKQFGETEVGKAFYEFENATANVWIKDTQWDGIGRSKSLDDAWTKHAAARKKIMALLRPLIGLEP